jgi:hypothetical protein
VVVPVKPANGILSGMRTRKTKPVSNYRKVTLLLPRDLLEKATRASGQGITSTICQGLELVAVSGAYERLRALRARVKFSVDLQGLREG